MAAQPDYSMPKGRYIEVVLIGGRNLPVMDTFSRSSDPFCTISLGEENENLPGSTKSFKSSVKKKTLNPVWNEAFIFKDEGDEELVIKIYDEDARSEELIASVKIPTKDIGESEGKEGQWYPLTKKNKPAGELCMKIERFVDFRELKDRAKAFREQMEHLQDENESLLQKAHQADALKRQVDGLRTEVDDGSAKVSALSSENEKLEGQNADLESQLREVRDMLEDANGKLEIAKAAASDDAEHDEAVQKRLDEISLKYRTAEQQRGEASSRGDKLQRQLNQAEAEVDQQKRKQDQLEQKYNHLEEQYKKTRSQLEKLRKEHRKLHRQYEAVSVPAVVGQASGASQSASGSGKSQHAASNTYGEFLTGLGLVLVLYLHRAQNLE